METDSEGETVYAKHVVSANGPLSSPRMPEVPGMELFKGESFHTASWNRKASLAGKRVGVIGTGASAAQVITSIADEVESLTVFQRTATWALPRDDEPTPPEIVQRLRLAGTVRNCVMSTGRRNFRLTLMPLLPLRCFTMKNKTRLFVKVLLLESRKK